MVKVAYRNKHNAHNKKNGLNLQVQIELRHNNNNASRSDKVISRGRLAPESKNTLSQKCYIKRTPEIHLCIDRKG